MKYNLSNQTDCIKIDAVIAKAKKDGSILEVIKPKIKRSIDQNSLLWLWLTFISDTMKEFGHDLTPEHYYCLFLTIYPVYIDGSEIRKTSSMFTVEEMTWFLNQINIHASTEWGFTLPDPEDKKAEAYFKQNGYEL